MFKITRDAFTLFGFDVYWYGLIIAFGVLLASLLAIRREKRLGFERDTALNLLLLVLPVGVVCARLYYVVFSWDYYVVHPEDIFNFRQGGLAVYGGIIGGVLAGWIYCRVKKLSFLKGLDLFSPSLALGQAIGRWGNFINQEAYGRQVLNPGLQFFPAAVQIGENWHYATFFYESAWCALIVVLILAAERKKLFKHSGDVFGTYLLLYGIERALVEGLRTDSLYIASFRVSQLLSLVAVLFVCAVLLFRAKGLHKAVRALPAANAVLLGAALVLDQGILSVLLALTLIALAAVVYVKCGKEQ